MRSEALLDSAPDAHTPVTRPLTSASAIPDSLLGDEDTIERRLAAASLIYGITPAQRKLAGYVVAGMDVVEAAGEMSISVTTARTHLQRMYEKTGVRSQAALVRTLLSVAVSLT